MTKTPENTLNAIKRYNASPKGRETRRKWMEANKEKQKLYQREYQTDKKMDLKYRGICPTCHKNKARKGKTGCQSCADRMKRYREERKMLCRSVM